MKRTVAAAIEAFEALPGLSDEQRRLAQAEITTAKATATRMATGMIDRRTAEITRQRKEWLEELCDVRQAFVRLREEGGLGRMCAEAYDTELRQLQGRQRQAEHRIRTVEGALAFVSAVEDDPLAYGDSLFVKFPALQPDFSF